MDGYRQQKDIESRNYKATGGDPAHVPIFLAQGQPQTRTHKRAFFGRKGTGEKKPNDDFSG
jgi:hypothetical protein